MQKLLDPLVDKLRQALDTRLASVILYGSAAAGDAQPPYSDLNVLCVLTQLSSAELNDVQPAFRWWRDRGQPSPLLFSREELLSATDCFPIEFHDLLECRRVLYGDDLILGLTVHDHHYRAQIEHELRSKLLRLRQKAASVLHDPDLLRRLLADSVSTFVILARHALRLSGAPAPRPRRDTLASLESHFGFPCPAFYTLLDLREGKTPPSPAGAVPLLDQYLGEIARLIAAVDRLER